MTRAVARMTRDMFDRPLPPRVAVAWAALVVGLGAGDRSREQRPAL